MPAPVPDVAVPTSPVTPKGPTTPNKARRGIVSKKASSPHKSVAAAIKMDGAKMSELATIKLKQMDGLTKKMKENYRLSQEQIEKDRLEIQHIDERLKTLHSRYDPLVVAFKERVALRSSLQAEFQKASSALKAMEREQSNLTKKMVQINQKLMKEDARQSLKVQRGFDCGKGSTYTVVMRKADTAKVSKAWKEGLAASAPVKVNTAFVDSKVKFDTGNVPAVKKGKGRTGALSSTPR